MLHGIRCGVTTAAALAFARTALHMYMYTVLVLVLLFQDSFWDPEASNLRVDAYVAVLLLWQLVITQAGLCQCVLHHIDLAFRTAAEHTEQRLHKSLGITPMRVLRIHP